MTLVKDNRVEEACSILFGEDFTFEKATLDYLQLSGIKHAFRERVKQCHPDMSGGDSTELQESFMKLKDAYDFLVAEKSGSHNPSKGRSTGPVSIPNRKLRLGEYLYYSGKISWKELIEAITWQNQNIKKNKPILFGLFFIRKGILTSSELGFSVFKQKIHNSNF